MIKQIRIAVGLVLKELRCSDETKTDRRLMHRKVYLAQCGGVPLSFSFVFGGYGPYSDELVDEGHECLYEPEVQNCILTQRCRRIIERVNGLEQFAQAYNVGIDTASWYDLLSVVAYVYNLWHFDADDIVGFLRNNWSRSKRFSESEIKAAFDVWMKYKAACGKDKI